MLGQTSLHQRHLAAKKRVEQRKKSHLRIHRSLFCQGFQDKLLTYAFKLQDPKGPLVYWCWHWLVTILPFCPQLLLQGVCRWSAHSRCRGSVTKPQTWKLILLLGVFLSSTCPYPSLTLAALEGWKHRALCLDYEFWRVEFPLGLSS